MFHCIQISESGSYAELLAKRGDFSDFIVEQLQGTEEETDEEEVKEVVDMIFLCFLALYFESSILTFISMKKMHKMVFNAHILRCGKPWSRVTARRSWRAKRSKPARVGKKTYINVFFLLLDFQIDLFLLFSWAVVPTDHLNGSPL